MQQINTNKVKLRKSQDWNTHIWLMAEVTFPPNTIFLTSGFTTVRLMYVQAVFKDWFDSWLLSCILVFIFENAASQVYVDLNMVSTYMANVFSVPYSWGQAT